MLLGLSRATLGESENFVIVGSRLVHVMRGTTRSILASGGGIPLTAPVSRAPSFQLYPFFFLRKPSRNLGERNQGSLRNPSLFQADLFRTSNFLFSS